LGRIEILGYFDRVHLRHAHALRACAPHGEGRHAHRWMQPRAARTELLDHTDELVARRKWRLRRADRCAGDAADICAGAKQRVLKRYAARQNFDADLANARAWIGVLHDPQHLGTTEVIDDNALHCAALDWS